MMTTERPNLDYIRELSGGDSTFETKILEIIKKEFFDEKESIIKAFEAKNLKETASLVHKTKHKISLLGLKEGYGIAENFEENLREGQTELYDEFEKVLDIVDEFVREL